MTTLTTFEDAPRLFLRSAADDEDLDESSIVCSISILSCAITSDAGPCPTRTAVVGGMGLEMICDVNDDASADDSAADDVVVFSFSARAFLKRFSLLGNTSLLRGVVLS
jgi:hypothetical protein